MNNTPPKPLLSPEQAQANEAARVAYKAYSEVRAQVEPLRLAWLKAEQHAYDLRHKAQGMKYQVIVGNVGTVLDTNCRLQANREYESYRYQSGLTYGRASGEPVTMMKDGEPIKEYPGTNHEHS